MPDADVRPISPFSTNAENPSGAYNPAAAVRTAAQQLGRGDVMLIELQAVVDVEGRGPTYGPIESIGSVRDAIRAAVDKGIVVVEPAGNGNMDLADMGVSYLQGQTAPGHSGALIVGAGGSDQAATGPSSRRRAAGSNYGSRVNLQGVGVGGRDLGLRRRPRWRRRPGVHLLLRRHLQRQRHRGRRRRGAPERREGPERGAPRSRRARCGRCSSRPA